jgi:DNA (cytosine-5)-methyltransferase 1
MGYYRAGFDVVGVDNKPQPRYPFTFIQGDALAYLAGNGGGFDAIHASPPCQAFSKAQVIMGREHPDLVTPLRPLLDEIGRPYVIENVPRAPLVDPVTLCGSMFGLDTKRHRLFESSVPLTGLPDCNHVWRDGRPVGVYGHTGGKSTGITSGNHGFLLDDWKRAMDIDWMSRDELAQAIPPAYTEFVGRQLMASL